MSGHFRKTRTFGAIVIAMSLITNSVGMAGAQAFPTFRPAPSVGAAGDGADVVQVEHRRGDGVRNRDHRGFDRRGHGRWDRGNEHRRAERRAEERRAERRAQERRAERRAEERRAERRAERRDDRRYRQGHRGYQDYRPGYRRDNDGWWYPLAAFALGAVILNQQNRSPAPSQSYTPSYGSWNHIRSGNVAAHDNWCDQQYRSYDRATKTFQPYNGPRKYCNSPYDLL